MRRRRATAGGCAVVLWLATVIASPSACREFRGTAPTSGGGAAGTNGGQPSNMTTEGGEPSSASAAGNAVGAGGGASLGVAGGGAGAALQDAGAAGAGGNAASAEVGGAGAGAGGASEGAPVELLLPSQFPGLVLWLEATDDTCTLDGTDHVSACRDASSFGNDAFARPEYEPPKYSRDAINGHAALEFQPITHPDGDYPSGLQVADADSLQFGTGDFAYVLAMRWSNSVRPVHDGINELYSGSGAILGKQQYGGSYEGVFLMANFPSPFGSPDAASRFAVQLSLTGPLAISYHDGLNDDMFRVYAVRRHATDLALRINGQREGATEVSSHQDVSGQRGNLLFGGNAVQPLRGDIAEVIALKGAFTDDELLGLERHLMRKYALK